MNETGSLSDALAYHSQRETIGQRCYIIICTACSAHLGVIGFTRKPRLSVRARPQTSQQTASHCLFAPP